MGRPSKAKRRQRVEWEIGFLRGRGVDVRIGSNHNDRVLAADKLNFDLDAEWKRRDRIGPGIQAAPGMVAASLA